MTSDARDPGCPLGTTPFQRRKESDREDVQQLFQCNHGLQLVGRQAMLLYNLCLVDETKAR